MWNSIIFFVLILVDVMRILLLSLFTLLTLPSYGQVNKFTLDNGLKILVKEDHRAPVAVVMVWYRVGSADEQGGKTGIAHALEHLMFKGTARYPLGVFSRTIASLGGQENAFTNTDYTAYFEKIAATHLPTSFALEADRMQNILLNPDEFQKEMSVIKEERRLRTDNNPQALTFERFLAAAHLAAPYHHPVIGWMSDLEQMNLKDVKAWYHNFYAPNNATLVVVGDVKPEEVFNLAKIHFGPLKKSVPTERVKQIEPPALGKKSVIVQTRAEVPMLMQGYTVPSVVTATPDIQADPYALEIIAGILDAGEGARLRRHLIRGNQTASNIGTDYNLYTRYESQFIVYGSPSQTNTLDSLSPKITAELVKLQQELVSDEELKRVKTQLIAEKTFERDSIFGQAMELGLLETIGLSSKTAEQYESQIQNVTAAQIQSAAVRYFKESNLTEARLIPTSPQPQLDAKP